MGVSRAARGTRPSQILKRRQQVAAICYRIRKRGIEFLLVQTRGGRWIFPKGGVEPGLTRAQSAALEAFEEAGVHGRMEEIPFTSYFRRKSDLGKSGEVSASEFAVTAHLCEVSRLEEPQESNRNPTWFSAEKAKQQLVKDRVPGFGIELTNVVDRALTRIQRLHNDAQHSSDRMPGRRPVDPLQRVQFEAFEDVRLADYAMRKIARTFLRQRVVRSPGANNGRVQAQAQFRETQRASANKEVRRPLLRLGSGTIAPAEVARKITAIDSGRRANFSNSSKPVESRTERSKN
jgi:8-oxo-dGTP pyrophosphatase MutT (NUDIX family)